MTETVTTKYVPQYQADTFGELVWHDWSGSFEGFETPDDAVRAINHMDDIPTRIVKRTTVVTEEIVA